MEVNAFIADDVEAVNGKLYTLGAGWDVIRTRQLPTRHDLLGLGVIIRVPYTATNQKHTLEVGIEDEDGGIVPLNEGGLTEGAETVEALGGEFNIGRPPNLPAGAEQVVAVAFKFKNVVFEREGFFRIPIRIDGTQVTSIPFRIEIPPQFQPRQGSAD